MTAKVIRPDIRGWELKILEDGVEMAIVPAIEMRKAMEYIRHLESKLTPPEDSSELPSEIQFVSDFMNSFETGKFKQDKVGGYFYYSENGQHGMDIKHYFERIVAETIESIKSQYTLTKKR
jgi:hypothetical protein